MAAAPRTLIRERRNASHAVSETWSERVRTLAGVAAAAAAFGFPVWIMVSTLGGPPTTPGPREAVRSTMEIPYQIVRSSPDGKSRRSTADGGPTTKGAVTPVTMGEGESTAVTDDPQAFTDAAPKASVRDGIVTAVPVKDESLVLISH